MNSAAHGRSLCSQITMNEWSECQTDRRTTYDNNTALCTVHCAVKNGQYLCRYDVMKLFRLLFGPPCTFAFISYVLYCYRFTATCPQSAELQYMYEDIGGELSVSVVIYQLQVSWCLCIIYMCHLCIFTSLSSIQPIYVCYHVSTAVWVVLFC